MTKEEFEAFKTAWSDYPSQDNEGYVPDRGGFKCGFASACNYKNIEISNLQDENYEQRRDLLKQHQEDARIWQAEKINLEQELHCLGVTIEAMQKHYEFHRNRDIKLTEALESISKNSCCNTCQEAKLVALSALKK